MAENQLGNGDPASLQRQIEEEQGPPEEVDAHGRPLQPDDDHYPEDDIDQHSQEYPVKDALEKLYMTADVSPEGRKAEEVANDMGMMMVKALSKEEGVVLSGMAVAARQAADGLPRGTTQVQLLDMSKIFSLAHAVKTGEPVFLNKQEI